jgi:hypothetical protein
MARQNKLEDNFRFKGKDKKNKKKQKKSFPRHSYLERKQIREIVSNSRRLLIIFDKLDIKCVFRSPISVILDGATIFIVRRSERGEAGKAEVEMGKRAAIKKFHKNDLDGHLTTEEFLGCARPKGHFCLNGLLDS